MAVAEPAAPKTSIAGAPAAIRTRALTKRYGSFTAVDKLDLTIKQGEVFGLLGPNGAGKTTTILMLLGLSEPTSGTARVLDMDPARDPISVKRRVGYMPDSVGFYGAMTGRQNLRYTARLNGVPKKAAEDHIDELLVRVGLVNAADSRVETYSRGMKQRLGLADVMVKRPSIVILDEPTTAIDPAGVEDVLALIRELAHGGAAVLLASHLLHQVQQVCDQVGIFVAGKLVASGAMDKLSGSLATGPIEIEVGAPPPADGVRAAALKVSGVTSVDKDPRDPRLWVVRAKRDVRAELARALVEAGHAPYHLRRRGDELDEIYRRYFADYATEAPEDAA
ncbi:MAG: type transport system ATP-binding protein [Chloroflexota bacterium]|jgi:ABC-2 type transport system ATP-binding protein|nr:type transport system ATP-binding protein [Chloroflexota bacterium]